MKIRKQIALYLNQLLDKQVDVKINKKIFFLHIPKCGGTSLNKAIQNSLGLTNECDRQKSIFSLDSSASRKCAELIGDKLVDYRKKLLVYNMSIASYKYIHGHFTYSDKVFQEFSKEWSFLTVLRHPVSQWFSQYFYDIREDSGVRIEADLESFVKSTRALLMGNTYVRKLTEGISANDASSPEAIEQAIANLNNFALVGLLERLDTFARDYKNIFGAELVFEKLNSSPTTKSKQQEQITDKIRKQVEEICQPNIKVYNSVIKSYES